MQQVTLQPNPICDTEACVGHPCVLALLCTFVVCCIASCGGGTTGTSSTELLKFSGFAERSDGLRAAEISMTVKSAATDENIQNSGTDKQGNFDMRLPAAESAFVVDVPGVGATTVTRLQIGGGTMAAKLIALRDGTLTTGNLFESQVDESTLCSDLTLNDNSLIISGEVGSSACPVSIQVASSQIALTSFSGRVEATCNGTKRVVATAQASASGVLVLDLNDAFNSQCKGIRILVSSPQAQDLQSEFTVE